MDDGLFDTLLQRLIPCPPPKIAIAVSGGGDSMALLSLMNAWTKKRFISLYPLIVNHGLRPDALQEALCVQGWIKTMGMNSEILHWNPSPPLHSAVMEKARRARYGLLALACHRQGISHLCVAHHLDDVLETVWMRERQHSPWRGLAGMSALTFHYGIEIVRPLLTTSHEALEHYLKEKRLPWVQDPSNSNPLFLRTQARHAVKGFSAQERLALTARTHAYGHRRQQEDHQVSLLHEVKSCDNFLILDECSRLKNHTLEQGSLLLTAWMASFSPLPLKGLQIQSLWKKLVSQISSCNNTSPKTLMTAGGCLFVCHKGTLFIFREGARVKETPCQGKKEWIWDHRFFCYGVDAVTKQTVSSGSWMERYRRASLPLPWPHPHILFRWCSPPFPHFRGL